jgi:hypothetical protein
VPPLRHLLGERIKPLGFTNFEYQGAPLLIPVDAWDIDIESPPHVDKHELEGLRRRGEENLERIAEYVSEFAKEFEKVDVSKVLVKI